jgi:hypothetical protein
MGQFDPEIKSAEVRHVPVQSRQPQQALNKARRLAERYPEQHFHRQTSLDRGVTEYPRSAPLAGRFCIPVHLRIEPDRKRAAAFQRTIVGSSVRSLVGRRCWFAHANQLPPWIHEMNPAPDLCNRAHSRSSIDYLKRLLIREIRNFLDPSVL